MRAAALPPGRNRQESRHGKAPPVHLHERRSRRPNRRSPALNRPRPKWKPSCESRSSTTGRGTLPRSAGSSTASRRRNDGGRRKNRDSVWSAAYRPYRTRAAARRAPKAQGIPKEVAGPAEKQEQEELRKEPPSKGTRPTGRPRLSDNTPDPSRGPVGTNPHLLTTTRVTGRDEGPRPVTRVNRGTFYVEGFRGNPEDGKRLVPGDVGDIQGNPLSVVCPPATSGSAKSLQFWEARAFLPFALGLMTAAPPAPIAVEQRNSHKNTYIV